MMVHSLRLGKQVTVNLLKQINFKMHNFFFAFLGCSFHTNPQFLTTENTPDALDKFEAAPFFVLQSQSLTVTL